MTDLEKLNKEFRKKNPEETISWALKNSKNPILTTNFRPYEIAIIHLCTQLMSDLKIVWCDSGYNTKATYVYAEKAIKEHNLNIKLYIPKHTSAFREATMGKMPEWITNLRTGQTSFRDELNIFNRTEANLLKISPFYYWADKDLDDYMEKYNLTNEYDYYDPTKVDEKRECGLHNREGK